jgi:hypothetical protein
MTVSSIPRMLTHTKIYIIPQTFLNGYKHLKNGYLKFKNDIASEKGTLGMSLN